MTRWTNVLVSQSTSRLSASHRVTLATATGATPTATKKIRTQLLHIPSVPVPTPTQISAITFEPFTPKIMTMLASPLSQECQTLGSKLAKTPSSPEKHGALQLETHR